ncbi:aldehyde reductase [Nocardia panacis]|uniref:Aldehyde reductase n=1 Tax=Nocardia panacis TaxID=2340916 RepID=A0A3A4KQN4_9NOCA|nr:aldehyde reductase [Nocardia panacis]RJO78341.1 aldehyde reductase [Nocardia panacis]
MDQQVLVTGATGFIAGHVIEELLEHGYAVRATVRDLANTRGREHLLALADRLDAPLDFVTADLTDESGWAAAVSGCDAVLHVASPFPATEPENAQALVDTAVQGTLRVLRACAAAGSVRRVVLTSSTAAITYGHRDRRPRTEEDWSIPEASPAYPRSKTLAERAAWAFVEKLPDDSRFELAVVNPGMVLGPLQTANPSTSHEPILRLLSRSVPGSPRVGWATVDVRDLARAHRLALETPSAAGNRYICAGEHVWMSDLARLLATEYPRIPTRELPSWLVRTLARFDKGIRLTVAMLDRVEHLSPARARRDLGWTARPLENTVHDTAASLLAHGLVPTR